MLSEVKSRSLMGPSTHLYSLQESKTVPAVSNSSMTLISVVQSSGCS